MQGLFSYAGGIPIPPKNNRGKQGRSICTPAKRLLGTGTQSPEKSRQRRSFSSPLTGRLRVLPDAMSIRLSSRSSLSRIQRPQGRVAAPPVERLARQQSGHCRGLGAAPNKQILQVFAKAKICKIVSCVPRNTACH